MPSDAAPTSLTERALGPDLSRGFMLLFIALANSHYFLQSPEWFGGFPYASGRVDGAVAWLLTTFVDGRAFPMFGLLFGYGVAQIVRRQGDSSRRAVRRLLWRRAVVLILVGFLHATLLYAGDILTAYGVLLLFGAWMVHWRGGWLLAVAAAMLALITMPSGDSLATSLMGPDETALPRSWADLGSRSGVSLYVAALGPFGFLGPFAAGLWAGRRRILERPENHLRLLRTVATVGIGVAVVGAQPVAAIHLGLVSIPNSETLSLIGPWHDASGVAGGIGYAALLALIAHRVSDHPCWFITAVQAAGQRSMTCYLAQSVVWTIAFTPVLLDLSDDLSVIGVAMLAVTTWVLTVVLADRLRRAGSRGPFETLIRRVTYGPPSLIR
ncbi:hypothetical protein CH305_06125 [Rhodococcus sp. 15-649-2-2]|uniref:DUF418 domain-containing protein n=1 Tax=Rhodococcus sp. 15-649-2-2 TaxID=2023140 RepID=UPI000B9B938A|nr:DUF418 domain-containing protein [Rhodococcus sp. 15-649-2-2]OZE84136.1 hypothetical protein CH305_06125 [Rhodococcus sp. 15-649-2-2]